MTTISCFSAFLFQTKLLWAIGTQIKASWRACQSSYDTELTLVPPEGVNAKHSLRVRAVVQTIRLSRSLFVRTDISQLIDSEATIIEPIPSSVRISNKREWGKRPSRMWAALTP